MDKMPPAMAALIVFLFFVLFFIMSFFDRPF